MFEHVCSASFSSSSSPYLSLCLSLDIHIDRYTDRSSFSLSSHAHPLTPAPRTLPTLVSESALLRPRFPKPSARGGADLAPHGLVAWAPGVRLQCRAAELRPPRDARTRRDDSRGTAWEAPRTVLAFDLRVWAAVGCTPPRCLESRRGGRCATAREATETYSGPSTIRGIGGGVGLVKDGGRVGGGIFLVERSR